MIAQLDRPYLQQGPRKVLRRLVAYFLYEGRPLTTRGRFFNVITRCWLKLCASAFPGKGQPDAVFIVGMGRTGSTILGKVLSVHRDIAFLNEPKALWNFVDPAHDVNGNQGQAGGKYRFGRADASTAHIDCARRLYSSFLFLSQATTVLDKYPEMVFRIDYLLAMFPNAKFIFLTRNPDLVINSVALWSDQHAVGDGAGASNWWGPADYKWQLLREQLVNTDGRHAEVRELCRVTQSESDKAAVEWLCSMTEGLLAEERHPDKVLRVRYEDLVQDSAPALSRILEFMQLDQDAAVFEYASQVMREDKRAAEQPVYAPELHSLIASVQSRLGY